MMLPDDAFRRLSVRCGLGPISRRQTPQLQLCPMWCPDAEGRMQGCIHTQRYRIMRHDTIGHWLHDHIATRKKWTVIHEQKTRVSTPTPTKSLTCSSLTQIKP